MELQGLQEALKVEIQCHQKLVAQMKQDPQDGELKKQLHERQTRITSLSEKQKLAVRTCPVGTTKPLSLVKPAAQQSIAISVVPAKAPISMVTAHINGQKAAASPEPLQTSPINLQTASRVAVAVAAAGAVHPLSRRASELPHSQMLGTLTATPIKVPQVSSLHRLAGHAPTVLPQVRPKTQIPHSLPHSPCQELQPLSLQKATAVVSPKSQGAALPTANSTFSPQHRPGAQGDSCAPQAQQTQAPVHAPAHLQVQTLTLAQDLSGGQESGGPAGGQASSAGPGVAFALITTSPAASNGVPAASEAVKVQPLLFGSDSKVIILQPQAPSCSQSSPDTKADVPSQDISPAPSPSPPVPAPSDKKEEDPEKIAFMVALGLVTTDYLEELQNKRQERKRRSTANPAYSGLFEPERKRLASNYLNNPLFLSAQDTEEVCWKEDLEHDDHCSACREEGELQECHNCTRAFHPECLQPPLRTPPRGAWYCPKCQKKVLNKENMSWPQNFVQSYVTHKTVRQEEKRRLLRRNVELKKECGHLEEQDKSLAKSLAQCMDVRERLLGQQRNTQASLERIKALIRLIQRDQVIQVTMTATTTAEASLLSLPWIKPASTSATSTSTVTLGASSSIPVGPSALLQRSQPQAQGNN